MKKLIATIFLISSISSVARAKTNEPIYTFADDTIVIKQKFIDGYYLGDLTETTPYVLTRTEEVRLPDSSGKSDLRLLKYRNDEDEWIEFNVIELVRNGVTTLQLQNTNGWGELSPSLNLSGNYIRIELTNNTIALIFEEYIYASQPSNISIIIITENEAKLIYNKPMFINSVNITGNSFSMELQSNTVEYKANGTPYDAPITHKIWLQNNVLWFKDL